MLFHDVGNQILASYYPRLISFSILYYDYIITLSAEIELFWPVKRRLTWPSALFLINRYLSILGHIPVALEMFAEPSHLNDAFYALLQFIVAVICIMRIAAIYENNRTIIISFLVLTLGGGAFVATFLFLHSSSKDSLILVDLPVSGCNVESSTS
ncbi:hypothetical protein BC834DRAFT_974494 [Gloeopeniophorella convolvens]|nr:hypothetical protein BC834DRAFT_974494 [Gloeopeniophorella convolvens]